MKHKKPEEIKHERLASLDTLRGFDMFWIIGGDALIIALAAATGWGWLENVAEQMEHVPWNGFHFEDLIFPLFMFISGVAIPFAILSKIEKGGNRYELLKKQPSGAYCWLFWEYSTTGHCNMASKICACPVCSVKSGWPTSSPQPLPSTPKITNNGLSGQPALWPE